MKNKNLIKKSKSTDEYRVYGQNACYAVFKNRPQDIIQLFFTPQKKAEAPLLISEMTKTLAKNKKAYHLVTREELDSMTKATHHEDISLLVKKKPSVTLENFLAHNKNKLSLLLLLEDVSNPHNVGAIMRTAAHFGADGLIITQKKVGETASAQRVSEGGSEYLHLFETQSIKETLLKLKKANYQILTTSSHATKELTELKWHSKVVIVFGEEANGISKELLGLFEGIKIPGTDFVESLNVSVAASILMHDYYAKIKRIS